MVLYKYYKSKTKVSDFEELVNIGIKQILAGIRHL